MYYLGCLVDKLRSIGVSQLAGPVLVLMELVTELCVTTHIAGYSDSEDKEAA